VELSLGWPILERNSEPEVAECQAGQRPQAEVGSLSSWLGFCLIPSSKWREG
jgi:hypothetical protein